MHCSTLLDTESVNGNLHCSSSAITPPNKISSSLNKMVEEELLNKGSGNEKKMYHAKNTSTNPFQTRLNHLCLNKTSLLQLSNWFARPEYHCYTLPRTLRLANDSCLYKPHSITLQTFWIH